MIGCEFRLDINNRGNKPRLRKQCNVNDAQPPLKGFLFQISAQKWPFLYLFVDGGKWIGTEHNNKTSPSN